MCWNPVHGRGNDGVYYGTYGSRDTSDRRVYERRVIYEQSKGIGWLINALCDQCLFAGAIEHVSQIDDRLVRRVGQVI
jgi:hypothetical protein